MWYTFRMNRPEMLPSYSYRYYEGPLSLEQLQQKPPVGNCRRAVQDYYWTFHGKYLGSEDIVFPEALKNEGIIVKKFQNDTDDFSSDLQTGDIVYAEKLRDSRGIVFSSAKHVSLSEEERMRNFHLGVYIGVPTAEILARIPTIEVIDKGRPTIWHASFIAGGTDLWPVDRFCYYYRPVLATRLLTGE